jgi:hypothetical protein
LDDARAATLDETPVMVVQEDTAIAAELIKNELDTKQTQEQ